MVDIMNFILKFVDKSYLSSERMVNTAPLLNVEEIRNLSRRAQRLLPLLQQKGLSKETGHRLLGEAQSFFKGMGLDYEESRAYQFGDEVRLVDWRLTARSGEPHIKVYREDSRPGAFLLVDKRSAMRFGTRRRLKAAQAARVAAFLAFAMRLLNTPVAGVSVESKPQWISQSNDEAGVLDFIHKIISPCSPVSSSNDEPPFSAVLKSMLAVLTRGSRVYLVSDFKDLDEQNRALLMHLAAEHCVSAIHIFDSVETQLPSAGQLRIYGTSELRSAVVNTSDPDVRQEYEVHSSKHFSSRQKLLSALNIPYIRIATDSDKLEDLSDLIA